MTRQEIRAQARANLKGNWGLAIGAWLLYTVIIGAASMVPFGSLVLTGPLGCGLVLVYVNFARGYRADIQDLFAGFRYFVNSFVAGLLVGLFTFLWSLLLIVPGIIKAFSYSMTLYILNDNPEMSGKQAIDRSRQLMDGHKMDLFLLELSFIGWMLLCVVTFGIALFYVAPYMQEAIAVFYKDLCQGTSYRNTAPQQPNGFQQYGAPQQMDTLQYNAPQPIILPQYSETQQTDFCANCGHPIQPNAKFCTNCGTPVVKEEEPAFCPGCGNKLKKGEQFCPLCGIRISW